MIKSFIKRIITEVIKELISPELTRFEQAMIAQQEAFRNEMRLRFEDFVKSMDARFEGFAKGMDARFEDFAKSMDARFEDFKSFVIGELAKISREIEEIRVDIRNINRRIDDLYQVVVRREEHYSLVEEVRRLRDDVEMLKRKVFQQ